MHCRQVARAGVTCHHTLTGNTADHCSVKTAHNQTPVCLHLDALMQLSAILLLTIGGFFGYGVQLEQELLSSSAQLTAAAAARMAVFDLVPSYLDCRWWVPHSNAAIRIKDTQ